MKKNKESIFEVIKRMDKNEMEEKKRVLEEIKNDKGIYTYVMGLSFGLWCSTLVIFILSFVIILGNNIEQKMEVGILGMFFSLILMIVYGVELKKLLKQKNNKV